MLGTSSRPPTPSTNLSSSRWAPAIPPPVDLAALECRAAAVATERGVQQRHGGSSVSFEHANSAFLCVGPQGEDYLTYAGSTELTAFDGWGHARIGLARSTDLVNWQVPPG